MHATPADPLIDSVCLYLRVQALMHAVMGMGIVGLVGKLHKWDESAMFFDGSSLGACLSLVYGVL